MKKLLLFSCIPSILLCNTAQYEGQAHKKTVIEQTVVQTIINQRSPIIKQPLHLFGKKLNAYLNNLNTDAFKDFFPQLPLRGKIMYMLTMTLQQYELFLDRYTNEEWTAFWRKASEDEQNHLPKTRVEQLALIRDAYYAYLQQHNSMFFPYFNPKAPYPSDIYTFKKQFYEDDNVPTQFNDMHVFARSAKSYFLNAYIHRKRYELFNL